MVKPSLMVKSTTMMPRLLMADPALRNHLGHHWRTSLGFAAAAREYGVDMTVLADRRFVDGGDFPVPVLPCFQENLYTPRHPFGMGGRVRLRNAAGRRMPLAGRIAQPIIAVQDDFDEDTERLDRALDRLGATMADQLFFHTCTPASVTEIIGGLSRRPAERRPRLHLLFRYDEASCPGGGPTGFFAPFRALREDWQSRVRLFCETEDLAAYYEAGTGLTFDVLPTMAWPSIPADAPPGGDAGAGSDALTLAYLGDARVEKGFLMLPDVVEAIAAGRGPAGRRIHFHIQSHFNIPGGEPGIRAARAALARFAPDLVTLYDTPLDNQTYESVLRAADVILLPYSADTYRRRGSGVLAEALVAGKPVIGPANTWIGRQISQRRGRLFHADWDFTPQLLDLLEHVDACKAAAREHAGTAIERHSPRHQIERLLTP